MNDDNTAMQGPTLSASLKTGTTRVMEFFWSGRISSRSDLNQFQDPADINKEYESIKQRFSREQGAGRDPALLVMK